VLTGTESGSDTVSSASALSAEGSEDWLRNQVVRSTSPSSDDTLGGPLCQPLPLPDLRSPDSIERDVAEKEWKLAEVYFILYQSKSYLNEKYEKELSWLDDKW
jgi:hypothetical protein